MKTHHGKLLNQCAAWTRVGIAHSSLMAALLSGILFQASVAPASAASDCKKAATGGEAGIVGWEVTESLKPTERQKLNKMPTQEAWDCLLTPPRFFTCYCIQHGRGNAQDREAQKLNLMARLEGELVKSSIPLDAYNVLCEKLAGEMGEAFSARLDKFPPRGGSQYALAVGSFTFTSRPGSAPDPKIAGALQSVIDHFTMNPVIQERVACIAYDSGDAKEIMRKIGGDTDNWLNPSASNIADVSMKGFHPADIYILTGGKGRSKARRLHLPVSADRSRDTPAKSGCPSYRQNRPAQTFLSSDTLLAGRFLRQAFQLLSSEATKQLPVTADVSVHKIEAISRFRPNPRTSLWRG